MRSFDTFFLRLRQVITGLLTLVFTFVIVYVPQAHIPPKYSTVPTVEAAGIPVNDIIHNAWTFIKPIGFHIAKAMISQLLQSLVKWINTGFQGSPAFIQDFDRFLLNVADEAAGQFIKNELGAIGSFICEPFRLDIQLALSLKYQQARTGSRQDRCSLSGIIDNVETFYKNETRDDDFWKKWLTVTSNPTDYTPYGQFAEADAQLQARLVNRRGQEISIANWNDGFLSGKICEVIQGKKGPKKQCSITKPGRVIADQLNKALGAGVDSLVSADEIDEVVGALLGQIANQAITGAAGLLGLSRPSSTAGGGSGPSYLDQMASESSNQVGPYSETGLAQLRENLAVSERYNALAVAYIPRLEAVVTDSRADDELREEAQFALEDALMVREGTADFIARLRPLVTEFTQLEAEYASSKDPERKSAIRRREGEIISAGYRIRVYTEDRYRESLREWSRITGN